MQQRHFGGFQWFLLQSMVFLSKEVEVIQSGGVAGGLVGFVLGIDGEWEVDGSLVTWLVTFALDEEVKVESSVPGAGSDEIGGVLFDAWFGFTME